MNACLPPLRFFGILGLLFFLAVPLSALEFRVLSWQGSLDGIFLLEGSKRVPILGEESRLSPKQTAPSAEQLTLYREVMVEQRLVPVVVVALPMPREYSRAILVLSQNPANPSQVSGFWLNDTLSAFPVGSFVFHNLSQHSVALKVEGQVRMLESRESWQAGFSAASRRTHASAAIQDGEAIRHILNHALKTHPDYRILLVFRNGRPHMEGSDEIDMPVEYVMIYDHQPPENPSGDVSGVERAAKR
jgi:hypothetical protein